MIQDAGEQAPLDPAARACGPSLDAARLVQIIEALADAVLIVSRDGYIVQTNAAAEQILRLPRQQIEGAHWQRSPWRRLTLAGSPLPDAQHPLAVVQCTGQPLHQAEYVIEAPDGVRTVVSANAAPLHDAAGAFDGAVLSFTDVTERKRLEQQLRRRAFTDELTGLANRAQFMEALLAALNPLDRPPGAAVLYLDLDHFKTVNDRHGHGAGDELLVAVAPRLRSSVRPDDLVARLGGDEFVVVLPGMCTSDDALKAAERVRENLQAPFTVTGHKVYVTASIGVAVTHSRQWNPYAFLHAADLALYEAKRTGRDRVALAQRI